MSEPLSDDELRATALQWGAEGRSVAIATVVETWGSAPRRAGAHLVVDQNGLFAGSISGGCVEAEVILAAQECIASGEPKLMEFGIEDETAWRVGLPCGGKISIYIEKLG
jgi:xanthine/CO dehydrogenase XdhC/CoxF family maturation factor